MARLGIPFDLNPVVAIIGRRLRLAVIGGGAGPFIGPVHRQAARTGDAFERAPSSDPRRALPDGLRLGPPGQTQFPNAFDGLQGLLFTEAMLRSSAADGAWLACQRDWPR